MPVEIRELLIRTSINQQNESASTSSENSSSASCPEETPVNQSSNQLSEMSRMIEEQNER